MTVDGDSGDEAAREVEIRLDRLLADHPVGGTALGAFLRAQYEAGLAWVHFPMGFGGLGVDRALQQQVDARIRLAGGSERPRQEMLGYRMGAPTVLKHGTSEQKHRYLLSAFTMKDRWCQLFSEPGSGSDLASVATKARRDGDHWVVDGQKVWSSYAAGATIGMLLARTDPDVPKHRGLTFFAVDMAAPGIEVRPLRQLTGEHEFNEVFLSGVVVSDDARIGAEGDGWRVAQSTLASERSMYGSRGFGSAAKGTAIAEALALWRNAPGDAEQRARLTRLWIDSQVLAWTNERVTGDDAVPPAVAKITFAEVQQRGFELCLDLVGDGVHSGAPMPGSGRLFDEDDPRHRYLRSRANSLEGGSSEVMRNVIARRVLGLPSDDQGSRVIPWSQIPRN
jgi:alkylation response protein AidB-like acyl-CoA dehydrogenase